jgi:hypothetical protein
MAVPNNHSPPTDFKPGADPVITTIQVDSSRVASTRPQKHELFNSFLGSASGHRGLHPGGIRVILVISELPNE